MSYHLYQTEGIVLGGAPTGDSNKYYYLFTKELGLTIAFAQSVREVKSKLRGHMQDFSHIAVGLIRGRDTWRIVSASEKDKFGNNFLNFFSLKIIARISDLLKRLLHGEEKNEKLFNILCDGFSFISRPDFDKKNAEDAELLFVSKVLHSLGYWGGNDDTLPILDAQFSEEAFYKISERRTAFLKEINRALTESHL
ncbi:MAG: recombination protein O N-terminal domain-containing protein [Patescibacteria group bacterium]